MDLDIQGTAALLTASSSGLGKASARSLAAEGVNVVVNGRDEARLAQAVEEIERTARGEVVGVPGDVTNPDDVGALVETTVDTFGGIDHLVTSAGGPTRFTFFETSDEDWYEAFDLLLMSVVRVVREAGDHLRTGDGGSIVNITSIVTKEASPTNVLSSSVRMSVAGLAKVLAYELAPDVRVNAVLPGLYDTPRLHDAGQATVDASEVPLARVGRPAELGDTVAYLCSDRSSYLTGASIPVDGGAVHANL